MADIRIKDLANTATSVPADGYEVIDSASGGTEKISRDNKRLDMAAAFVADPATYNLAPLVGGFVEVAKGGTGAGTAAGARTSLDVLSSAEVAADIADAIGGVGLKLNGPALYFDGSTSDVTVAASPKFAFTDGVDDKPFTVEGWVKASTVANTFLFALYEATSTKRQFACYISATNKLRLELVDAAGDACYNDTDATLSAYDGQWIHVASVYAGAAAATFGTTAIDNVTHYINGVAVASTGVPNAAYGGMSDTGAVGYIGRLSSTRGEQHVSAVRVHNRALTATEVERLAKGNDLGFADEWGGAFGSPYTADWSSTTDSWTNVNTTLSQASGPVGGRSNVLQITANAGNSTHAGKRTISDVTVGKRYRVVFDYYLDAGNSHADGIKARFDNGTYQALSAVSGAWTRYEFEVVATANILEVYMFDGASQTFHDTGGDDNLWLDNLTVTEIGTLADFRAENYDADTSKLYDQSSNAFVGTGTGVTLTGRAYPVYETGTWTPTLEFGGASSGTYSVQEAGYRRIGNTVSVWGQVNCSSKSAATGSATIEGLPFSSVASSNTPFVGVVAAFNAANLTSQVLGLIGGSSTSLALYDTGATGTTALDDTNFNANTILRFSATYQIQ